MQQLKIKWREWKGKDIQLYELTKYLIGNLWFSYFNFNFPAWNNLRTTLWFPLWIKRHFGRSEYFKNIVCCTIGILSKRDRWWWEDKARHWRWTARASASSLDLIPQSNLHSLFLDAAVASSRYWNRSFYGVQDATLKLISSEVAKTLLITIILIFSSS